MDTETLPSTHNNPPPLTPLEQAKEEISLLTGEAANWFDGAPIENEKQAEDVARILDTARKASKRWDGERKEEKRPHDEAGKAVDASWKPVIADADRIVECAKKVQTVWLIKLDEAKRAEAKRAQDEADAIAAAARKLAAENDGSLEATKARDAAIEEAKRAEKAAARADKDKADVKGEGMARAQSLRTVYRAQVDDRRLLLNHIATRDPVALTEFVEDWAAKEVRAGHREIPGVTVIEEKRVA